MNNFFLTQLKPLIDWFENASLSKKLYIFITITAFGLYKLITYYDGEIKRRDSFNNSRIDTLTNKLEKCNEYSKNQSQELINILQESVKQTESLKLETEQLKLEVQKKNN